MKSPLAQPEFLPMSRPEMERLGWDEIDVLLVTGDAHVDHPSFAAPLLGRWLVAHGYRVGIVAQPDWRDPDGRDPLAMGRPRLLAGVTAGAVDSMLAHYTAFRKLRRDDAYTPGGRAGKRPNRATIVYAGMVRRAFPGLPVAAGGVEASLRRTSHYDFWEDKLRRPLALDAKLDVLLYGMAETGLLAIVRRLDAAADEGQASGKHARDPALFVLPGTVVALPSSRRNAVADLIPADATVLALPSHEAIAASPPLLLEATRLLERQVHEGGFWLTQDAGDRTVLVAPPDDGLDGAGLDGLYALPFTRRAHPSYREAVPALEMIRDSLTSHRGCGGGCTFCGLALHQGRRIRSRSPASLKAEAARLAATPGWHGSISDVGGPSANMWGARCRLPAGRICRRTSCLWPSRCRLFDVPAAAQVEWLAALRAVPGVKNLRVASGVRHDLALSEPVYLEALVRHYTGGQLKIAPEHIAPATLARMRKPGPEVFGEFLAEFERLTRTAGKRQFVVPYFMSAFPGTTDQEMKELADWLGSRGWRPQQVQCFIPTPGTAATAMYFGGVDETGRPLASARADAERSRQHAILSPSPAPPAAGRNNPRKPRRRGGNA